ncbi:FK506-binding protein 15 isoform X2 [Frieseomelitta varia]|uniref:FK506-binding protein 15 isoform X2 n=1 Tax=Frieseomelitta varia TaxID=561572 RepID=UPI001CB6A6E4|nr:FK506-binding protein 15 isoform X2 [Frieseomelitta varia]
MNVGNKIPNLDKILRDDDESDLMPAAGANLAAIFGSEAKRSSLSYSPTKQISKNLNTSHTLTQTISNKTEVIIAKAVYAFKFENGFYTSITVEGKKIGVALTRNLATKVYQFILYISKEKYVSVATVTHDFSYIIQPNNYSHYYDSNKRNWSILFENNDVCVEFAREIALARYFSKNGKIENVLYQDLSPVDSNKDVTVKEGDSISIRYLIVTDITQPLKDIPAYQTMTVEISVDDNWERALLESSKGLKRILFVPPNKQISLGPGFPKERDILLEIEIINIQTSEEAHLHKISSDKASIISRMARMGQSILPKLPSSTTDSEDTEDDMPQKSSHQKKIESFQEELQKEHFPAEFRDEMLQSSHQVLKLQSDESATNIACKSFVKSSVFTPQWSPSQPNFVTMGGQIYTDVRSLQPQTTTSTLPTIIDPGLNMLLSETRITNAELRMGMSKIADNVQKMLDKFHVLELQNATKNKITLDNTLKMLSMNLTGEKDSQSQNISNIGTDNFTQLIEMKERISMLEKELNQSKEQIKHLETQKESLMQTNENLHKTIKELEISLKDINAAFSNAKKDLEEATKLNSKYKEKTVALENKMVKLSEGCAEQLTNSKEINENDNKKKEIKCIMNKLYHALLDKFIDEYSVNYIRTIIADTIKNVTLQVLYNSDETNDAELKSNNVEAEVSKIDNIQSKVSDFTQVSSILQNEPPPIPPLDTEDDKDWLQFF